MQEDTMAEPFPRPAPQVVDSLLRRGRIQMAQNAVPADYSEYLNVDHVWCGELNLLGETFFDYQPEPGIGDNFE